MKEGQEVRILRDYQGLKKGDILICSLVEDDGIHYFVDKKGYETGMQSHRYELINETMKVGQKVRMLEDFVSFKKGEILTCCRVENDGMHYFVNKEGDNHYFGSRYYELINETMTKREKLEKAVRDIQAQIEALPKVFIGGYEMKQDGDIISFGCACFHRYDLKDWYGYLCDKREATNRTVKSITLDSGVEISLPLLKQIVENIED